MNSVELPVLMRKLSTALEDLSPEQIDAILKDELRFKIDLVSVNKRNISSPQTVDIENYVNQLSAMKERSVGVDLLQSTTKTVLQSLAKRFDLSVDSSMAKDKLIERIVERSIGLRLRQQAFAQVH